MFFIHINSKCKNVNFINNALIMGFSNQIYNHIKTGKETTFNDLTDPKACLQSSPSRCAFDFISHCMILKWSILPLCKRYDPVYLIMRTRWRNNCSGKKRSRFFHASIKSNIEYRWFNLKSKSIFDLF